jgi:hypothetical protein
VDSDGSGGLVISDYKTGKQEDLKDLLKDPVAGGRKLQLPLYALAASERFGSSGKVKARYWLLSSDRTAAEFNVELTDDLIARFRGVVKLISEGIEGGAFPGRPGQYINSKWENCSRCPFDAICPTNRGDQWARAKGDPVLEPVVRLSEGDPPASSEGAVTMIRVGPGGRK